MRKRSLLSAFYFQEGFSTLIACIVILVGLPFSRGYIRTSTSMVSLHGRVALRSTRRSSSQVRDAIKRGNNEGVPVIGTVHHNTYMGERPPDPSTLFASDGSALEERVQILVDWWRDKSSVFCITGAGLSTESGIPDYRGSKGSYFEGHKPMIHQQFMESQYQRKRYWGRSMVGWSKFDSAQPNVSSKLHQLCCVQMEFLMGFYTMNFYWETYGVQVAGRWARPPL